MSIRGSQNTVYAELIIFSWFVFFVSFNSGPYYVPQIMWQYLDNWMDSTVSRRKFHIFITFCQSPNLWTFRHNYFVVSVFRSYSYNLSFVNGGWGGGGSAELARTLHGCVRCFCPHELHRKSLDQHLSWKASKWQTGVHVQKTLSWTSPQFTTTTRNPPIVRGKLISTLLIGSEALS